MLAFLVYSSHLEYSVLEKRKKTGFDQVTCSTGRLW